ncbi:unnamed protein product [Rhodiola kirilowii]
MKLVVRVIEARNLPAMDLNGLSDPYVRLQLGRQRSRTKVVKKCLTPSWGEEFNFRVEDLSEELLISVMDEDKYFNDDFIGQLKVPVSDVFDNELKSLDTAWYSLKPKDKSSRIRNAVKFFYLYILPVTIISRKQNPAEIVHLWQGDLLNDMMIHL